MDKIYEFYWNLSDSWKSIILSLLTAGAMMVIVAVLFIVITLIVDWIF